MPFDAHQTGWYIRPLKGGLSSVSWSPIDQAESTVPPIYDTTYNTLTNPLLDKMAAILADDTFKYIFINENDRISYFTEIRSRGSNWR